MTNVINLSDVQEVQNNEMINLVCRAVKNSNKKYW